VARNARLRYAGGAKPAGLKPAAAERLALVEQRDLAVYEQILEAA
jgi:hypothetical protein